MCFILVTSLFLQQRLVEEQKQQAYNNLAEWILVSDPSIAGFPMLLGNAAAESFTNPNLGLLGLNFEEQGNEPCAMSFH